MDYRTSQKKCLTSKVPIRQIDIIYSEEALHVFPNTKEEVLKSSLAIDFHSIKPLSIVTIDFIGSIDIVHLISSTCLANSDKILVGQTMNASKSI
ncbi:unnamed protein product [Phytophthora lilii]|uniref:Unnamed protein product n=1 Tax=Phytophthora lilii TaxID=2077276 RepID=A0A9W6WNS4_9STRA|nr:unnamed protein product [Phytophthora lilii]